MNIRLNFGVLGLLFITLKLCGVIDWSWWLVLLPIYGPFVLAAVVIALGAALYAAFGP